MTDTDDRAVLDRLLGSVVFDELPEGIPDAPDPDDEDD